MTLSGSTLSRPSMLSVQPVSQGGKEVGVVTASPGSSDFTLVSGTEWKKKRKGFGYTK